MLKKTINDNKSKTLNDSSIEIGKSSKEPMTTTYESIYHSVKNKLNEYLSKELDIPFESINKFLHISKTTNDFDFTLQIFPLSKIHKLDLNDLKEKIKNLKETESNFENLNVKEISPKLENLKISQLIKKIEIVGSSANIFLNTQLLMPYVLNFINKKGSKLCQKPENGKSVIVEYSSPNIAKFFHPGHFRTTVLGNHVARMYQKFGYNVLEVNFLGDYGKQFGLIIEGIERFPDEKRLKEEPTKYAYEVYVKVSQLAEEDENVNEMAKEKFKKLEKNDPKVLAVWEKLRKASIEEYKKQYEILNIKFDIFSGESFFGGKLESDLLIKDEDGSKYFDLKKHGKYVVERSNGTSLYATRDIKAGLQRFETKNICKSIYVVASQQDLHFKQLFEVFSLINDKAKPQHISYGMVKGMSTRKGTVSFLSDIYDEAQEKMLEVMKKDDGKFNAIENPEKTALDLAVSALIIQDFSAKKIKDYEFNLDRFTSIEGNTGPYVQYTHCRLESIKNKNFDLLKKYGIEEYDEGFNAVDNQELLKNSSIAGKKIFSAPKIEKKNLKIPFEKIDFSVLNKADIQKLVSFFIKLDYIFEDCFATNEPNKIVTYLMNLCTIINRLFSSTKVLGQEDEIALSRLYIFESARYVLDLLFKLIGLKPLKRI